MFKVILMQGAPGSGKSTMAGMLKEMYEQRPASANAFAKVTIRSADEYWYKVVNPDSPDVYNFNPALSGKNHVWNQHRVLADMQSSVNVIIVDNTNTLHKEALPYIVLAKMFDYEIFSVRVDPGLEECIRRNAERPADRRVPEDVVSAMHARMEDLLD